MFFESLSNPYHGNFFATAEKLSVRQFNRTVNSANREIEQLGLKLVEFDVDAVESENLSTICWSPEVGSAQFGLYRENPTEDMAKWLSCQLRIAGFLYGLISRIEFEGTIESPIVAAGHLIKEPFVKVVGSGEHLTICNEDTVILQLEKLSMPNVLPIWVSSRSEEVIQFGSASVVILSRGDWVDIWENETPRVPLTSDWSQFRAEIEETTAFLESESPHYYVWASALIREVVPLADPGGGSTTSRSFGLWPGQIQMSAGASLLGQISMLIHECSHQYFHMARWFDFLVTDDAPEVYSVLKETNRPFEKLLLGFHAFGNVWLAFNSIRGSKSVIDGGEMARQEKHVRNYVESLDEQLQERYRQFLTDAGTAIYLPLRQALVEHGLMSPRLNG